VTDGSEQKRRPNANYKLSKPDGVNLENEERLVFYYNRERRLAKAPQSVRDLYSSTRQYRFNLLRPLIADKPRAFVFFTIIIMCAAIITISLLGFFDKSFSLDGNKLEITGSIHEYAAIVVIKKTVKNSSAYSGAVDIAVAAPDHQADDRQSPIFYHRVFFTLESVEDYRFVIPFNTPEVFMVLKTEKNTLSLKLKLD
jgi:hypothetical protein